MFKKSIRSKVLEAIEPRIKDAEKALKEDEVLIQEEFSNGLEALNAAFIRNKERAFESRLGQVLGFSSAQNKVGAEVTA